MHSYLHVMKRHESWWTAVEYVRIKANFDVSDWAFSVHFFTWARLKSFVRGFASQTKENCLRMLTLFQGYTQRLGKGAWSHLWKFLVCAVSAYYVTIVCLTWTTWSPATMVSPKTHSKFLRLWKVSFPFWNGPGMGLLIWHRQELDLYPNKDY